MDAKKRSIEVDAVTATALEDQARQRGQSVAEFLSDLTDPRAPSVDFEEMRASSRGPWSPEALSEDARAMAAFEETGEGIPFDEVVTWIESWGTAAELPMPKPRRL